MLADYETQFSQAKQNTNYSESLSSELLSNNLMPIELNIKNNSSILLDEEITVEAKQALESLGIIQENGLSNVSYQKESIIEVEMQPKSYEFMACKSSLSRET